MASGGTCPQGHTSDSTDYCDTCGSPMLPTGSAGVAGGQASAPAPAEAKPMGVVCPNCEVMNAPGALFCEACGYDYTTGTMPRPEGPSILDLDTPVPDTLASATPGPAADAINLESDTPARPTHSEQQAAGQSPSVAPAAAASTPAPAAAPPSAGEPESETFDWVLEIWVDPEWYALQESPDPMPSAGLPDIMPLRKRSLLIGRPSRSRNIAPDIDCEPDTGISRRQAELSTDGSRWFIEDLDSANGTFVAGTSEGLPTEPIPAGRRRELTGDERIYLGAWTRLVLRRATPEEREAYASA